MQVILQSGGVGSRLYPFTINKPKCFLKLKGKPIIDYQYENLKKYNLHKKIIVISNENHVHHFQRYFKNKKYKPKIISEKSGLGSGGSLIRNIKLLKKNFILIYLDIFFKVNFSKFLNKKAIMVILSQVYPGFTRSINFDHSRLFYQVETLVLGKAVDRALMPERIIIGCEKSESNIQNLFLNYLKSFNCPIIKMKYESAELAKISINILLASSITATNMLAQVCEKISADWYEIIPALRLDKRIGKQAYLKPGLGISGGNIERDVCSIQTILKKNQQPFSITKAFQENSQYMKSWVYRILKQEKIIKLMLPSFIIYSTYMKMIV